MVFNRRDNFHQKLTELLWSISNFLLLLKTSAFVLWLWCEYLFYIYAFVLMQSTWGENDGVFEVALKNALSVGIFIIWSVYMNVVICCLQIWFIMMIFELTILNSLTILCHCPTIHWIFCWCFICMNQMGRKILEHQIWNFYRIYRIKCVFGGNVWRLKFEFGVFTSL